MQHLTCSVLTNHQIAEGCHLLSFSCPDGFQSPKPGQFMTLRVGNGISPLLRRPFAYSAFDPQTGTGSFIYERRGNATNLLAAYEPRDSIDLIGPLGNTFPMPDRGRQPVLVAGGIGIGPMLFWYQTLCQEGYSPILLLGARSAGRIPQKHLPLATIVCTDDGSLGFHGTVLQRLQAGLGPGPEFHAYYACGPHGMMKALANWSSGGGQPVPSPTWVSLEQTMACAVGACMGCVVKIHHEKQYSRVCAEGPVYDANQIDWKA